MANLSASYRKSAIPTWRDRLLALGLLLVSAWLVSAAVRAHGHEIICLILQISAGVVLLAAAGLSLFLLSSPTLNVDRFGIGERGFLLGGLNWSMTWNEIAYAELVGEMGAHLRLVGLDSDEVEHTVSGYERFEAALQQIRAGLKQYGRRLIITGQRPPAYLAK
ncbi:MAG: hypothetical protein WD751_01710 [Anaerolineales bacterium]